jgi:glucose-6-phosphate 1-dehydrogenase
MLSKLVLFGATGDLAGRFLLPALARLYVQGRLPEDFQIIGSATDALDDGAFQRHAAQRLEQHASDLKLAAREALVRTLRYRKVDFASPDTVSRVLSTGGPTPLVAYLALPARVFPAAVTALGAAGLPAGSRIAIEKPFGENLESAVALNALLARVAGPGGEQAIFRVDHVLGMATVQNLLGFRMANRVFEQLWSSEHIERIDLQWEEMLALEGRAGFFDHAGTLKDVVQNHVFQLLCFVAMEPLDALTERQLRDRKVDVLRSVRRLSPAEVVTHTRRARYSAGPAHVPYAEEPGVDPSRGTETFCELIFELDTPRWRGTRFVVRAGKALEQRRKQIVVRFRPATHAALLGAPTGNALQIGIDGPEKITLHLAGRSPGARPERVHLRMATPQLTAKLPAYGNVLLDILSGGSTLSIRGDEAEEAWRVLDPVVRAWAEGRVPLEEYPAGSAGPPRLEPEREADAEPQQLG